MRKKVQKTAEIANCLVKVSKKLNVSKLQSSISKSNEN